MWTVRGVNPVRCSLRTCAPPPPCSFKLPSAKGSFRATVDGLVDEKKPAIVTAAPVEAVDAGGVIYYEVTVSDTTDASKFAIGFVPGAKLSFGKQLGDTGYTMGYHNDGNAPGSGFSEGPAVAAGDVLGVGWVYKERTKREDLNFVFFTLNGVDLGPRYWGVRGSSAKAALTLAPAVTAVGPGTFTANFGQKAFACAEMEALRLAAAARGEVVDGSDAGSPVAKPVATLSAGAPTAATVTERARVILSLNPAVPHTMFDLATKSVAAARGVNTAVSVFKGLRKKRAAAAAAAAGAGAGAGAGAVDGAESPIGSAAGVPPAPRAPVGMSRGTSSLGLGLLHPGSDTPKLRRVFSSGDSDAVTDGHTHGTGPSPGSTSSLLSHPSTDLQRATAHALELVDAKASAMLGVAPRGGFVKGLKGVLAFLLSPLPGSVVLQALEQRSRIAVSRLKALRLARELLDSTRTPHALQQLLWFIGTALCRSKRSAAAAGAADGGADGADADKKVPEDESDDNVILADLQGCGSGMLNAVRKELHALLDAVSMHIVAPAHLNRAAIEAEASKRAAFDPFGTSTAAAAAGNASSYVDVSALSDEHRMVQFLALRVWRAQLGRNDHAFLHSCSIFTNLKSIMGGGEDDSAGGAAAAGAAPELVCVRPVDVTAMYAASVPSNKDRLHCLTDSTTETFWEPGFGDLKAAYATFEYGKSTDGDVAKEPVPAGSKPQRIVEVAVHVDTNRDKGNCPSRLTLLSGATPALLSETPDDDVVLPAKFAGWAILRPAPGSAITAKTLQVKFGGAGAGKARVRGIRLFAVPVAEDSGEALPPALDASVTAKRIDVKGEALQVFRSLAESVFKSLTVDGKAAVAAPGGADAAPADAPTSDDAPAPAQLRRQTSDLRERVTGMLFGSSGAGPLGALQEHLFGLIGHELRQETARRVAGKSWRSGRGAGVEESKGDAGEKESKVPEGGSKAAGTSCGVRRGGGAWVGPLGRPAPVPAPGLASYVCVCECACVFLRRVIAVLVSSRRAPPWHVCLI
jgi:hypothetical protein